MSDKIVVRPRSEADRREMAGTTVSALGGPYALDQRAQVEVAADSPLGAHPLWEVISGTPVVRVQADGTLNPEPEYGPLRWVQNKEYAGFDICGPAPMQVRAKLDSSGRTAVPDNCGIGDQPGYTWGEYLPKDEAEAWLATHVFRPPVVRPESDRQLAEAQILQQMHNAIAAGKPNAIMPGAVDPNSTGVPIPGARTLLAEARIIAPAPPVSHGALGGDPKTEVIKLPDGRYVSVVEVLGAEPASAPPTAPEPQAIVLPKPPAGGIRLEDLQEGGKLQQQPGIAADAVDLDQEWEATAAAGGDEPDAFGDAEEAPAEAAVEADTPPAAPPAGSRPSVAERRRQARETARAAAMSR